MAWLYNCNVNHNQLCHIVTKEVSQYQCMDTYRRHSKLDSLFFPSQHETACKYFDFRHFFTNCQEFTPQQPLPSCFRENDDLKEEE